MDMILIWRVTKKAEETKKSASGGGAGIEPTRGDPIGVASRRLNRPPPGQTKPGQTKLRNTKEIRTISFPLPIHLKTP